MQPRLASLRKIDSLPGVATVASVPGPLTSANGVLGTLQYMTPEQLAGREADARTDLFALGVVFYEILTGGRPFRADTDAATIGAILQSRNGTFVRGDRITGPHRLIDGDQIALGSVLVTFRALPADASTESRASSPKSLKAREDRRGV